MEISHSLVGSREASPSGSDTVAGSSAPWEFQRDQIRESVLHHASPVFKIADVRLARPGVRSLRPGTFAGVTKRSIIW